MQGAQSLPRIDELSARSCHFKPVRFSVSSINIRSAAASGPSTSTGEIMVACDRSIEWLAVCARAGARVTNARNIASDKCTRIMQRDCRLMGNSIGNIPSFTSMHFTLRIFFQFFSQCVVLARVCGDKRRRQCAAANSHQFEAQLQPTHITGFRLTNSVEQFSHLPHPLLQLNCRRQIAGARSFMEGYEEPWEEIGATAHSAMCPNLQAVKEQIFRPHQDGELRAAPHLVHNRAQVTQFT